MAAIFLQKDAQELLKNKYVIVMGGSIQRSIYKDLIRLIQGNTFLTDNLLRMKGEDSCLRDKLLDGGMRGADKKGIGYREVRQYQTDFYFLQFIFMTRSYNTYIESVINKLALAEQKPDVIIVNSCLWDITRYGKIPVPEYKQNLHKLFKKLKSDLPECLVIWNTNPAISHNPKGGVFIPGLDYLKDSMELHVLEANYYASKAAVEYGHDVIDLHYFLRHQIHRRAEDGIHWDMTGHRRITNLILSHIAQTWGVKMPKHIKIQMDDNGNEINENSQPNNTGSREETEKIKFKSIFDVEKKIPEKPKHDDIVEVEVAKDKNKPIPNATKPETFKPKSARNRNNKRKRRQGRQWQNDRHSPVPTMHNDNVQVFNYNHQPQNVQHANFNFQSANQIQQNPFVPRPNPFHNPPIPSNQFHHAHSQNVDYSQNVVHSQNVDYSQNVVHSQNIVRSHNMVHSQNMVNQQNIVHQQNMVGNPFQNQNLRNNAFQQQDFRNDNFQMLNFDNGQWQPYQEEELSHEHFQNHAEHNRFNPYGRERGPMY
ncbi:PC-esterase domain-containing protein 1B-like [Mytilus edulis]|uniref:PC-esterase domain-containing protein 1B-like n=1 Tax=Mytilus edulis TaxID=6550 RepID=UPI0039F04EFE